MTYDPSTPTTPELLRFTATTVDGTPFDAATLVGKPAVLWFWAAWCPKCRAAADEVVAVAHDYAGKVNVIGVAGLGSGNAGMQKFIADMGLIELTHVADDLGMVRTRFGMTPQVDFVLLDAEGVLVHKSAFVPAEFRALVAALAN
ncbi:thiol-disulfide isomerase/thioredoxin [Allocatelliglobosispora scoriae]|uniref:Thiol-disulfide isomerase/thioredoxin n=1 Tax=Allocatelliglobosispora scoriae TaxID=643052 RepID=A0A841BSX3_9ACTN|nr:redoxin domain-containing protein [Allocatelliglobosispora scoriae]MBB5869842.1 thiol-disulfide isomerase/thioredoxin [Allocatelliglobosispora scoriae]